MKHPSIDRYLTLSQNHRKIIDLLRDFSSLKAKSATTDPSVFHELHKKILRESQILLNPEAIGQKSVHDQVEDPSIVELLVLAIAQASVLHEIVQGHYGLFDTSKSKTLRHHSPDFKGNAFPHWPTIAQILGLQEPSIKHINFCLQETLMIARKKSSLVEGFLTYFGLRQSHVADNLPIDVRIFRAFSALFPNHPLQPGEIELIASGTLIAFCIPFSKNTLLAPRFETLAPADKQRIEDFLLGIKKFQQEHFSRFPAFGSFDPEKVDADLIHYLATCKSPAWEPSEVRHELNRMVSILPLQEVDQYIVHDLWGHGWQGCLAQLDQHYHQIAEFDRPLHECTNLNGDPLIDSSLFIHAEGAIKWDLPKLEERLHEHVRKRLPIALTPVFAEMLADVIEYKFLFDHPSLQDEMPSSSVYKFNPTKLDLLITDIPFYFRQALKSIKNLNGTQEYIESILNYSHTLTSTTREKIVQSLINELKKSCSDIEQKDYHHKLQYETVDQHTIKINAFTKVVLNFVAIHQTIVDFDQDLHAEHPMLAPQNRQLTPHFRDLLVIASSLYFMDDPLQRLWTIDEYVTLILKPQCKLLADHVIRSKNYER